MQKGYLNINNGRIYYETSGSGEPIAFVHGFSLDSRVWNKQFDYFSSAYNVIRYDLRGFGKSSLPDSTGYSHVEDLKSLLDLSGIKKINLVGNSYGGYIILKFALRYPDRVKSMVLAEAGMNETTTLPVPSEFISHMVRTIQMARNGKIEPAKDHWLQGPLFNTILADAELASLVKQMVNDYSGWHWMIDDTENDIPAFNPEHLKDITIPTLILIGEKSNRWLHDISLLQHDYIRNSRFVTIDNAGHMMNLENRKQFNKEVENFIQNIP